ncbi:hypothetical protein [Paraburkholderia sp. J67]|uniref:hypothetical protein n=1 Tax=Paraburkholderia sp. J67 TaxID=2805435 RepID=UPI002ABE8DFC|nr:hypothetical protein [Paraburkholderia sp. J67]
MLEQVRVRAERYDGLFVIYCFRFDNGRSKIGLSRALKSRAQSYHMHGITGCTGVEVVECYDAPHMREAEKEAHRIWAALGHSYDRETFQTHGSPTDDLARLVQSMRAASTPDAAREMRERQAQQEKLEARERQAARNQSARAEVREAQAAQRRWEQQQARAARAEQAEEVAYRRRQRQTEADAQTEQIREAEHRRWMERQSFALKVSEAKLQERLVDREDQERRRVDTRPPAQERRRERASCLSRGRAREPRRSRAKSWIKFWVVTFLVFIGGGILSDGMAANNPHVDKGAVILTPLFLWLAYAAWRSNRGMIYRLSVAGLCLVLAVAGGHDGFK